MFEEIKKFTRKKSNQKRNRADRNSCRELVKLHYDYLVIVVALDLCFLEVIFR